MNYQKNVRVLPEKRKKSKIHNQLNLAKCLKSFCAFRGVIKFGFRQQQIYSQNIVGYKQNTIFKYRLFYVKMLDFSVIKNECLITFVPFTSAKIRLEAYGT